MQDQNRRHEEELRVMQDKLHNKNDAAFHKFKQHIQATLSRPSAPAPTNDQVRMFWPLFKILVRIQVCSHLEYNGLKGTKDHISYLQFCVEMYICKC